MADRTFTLLATVTASTKRRPDADGNELFQASAENLSSLKCTPLDTLDAMTANLLGLQAPYTTRQTFVQGGLDIEKGDILVVGSDEYDIKAVEAYEWTPDSATDYNRLVLELVD